MIQHTQRKDNTSTNQEMLARYESMIKIVVDIRRHFLSGGGEMHSDVANRHYWKMAVNGIIFGVQTGIQVNKELNFKSLINIRPRLGNRNIVIQDENLRKQVKSVTREILGGVQ